MKQIERFFEKLNTFCAMAAEILVLLTHLFDFGREKGKK